MNEKNDNASCLNEEPLITADQVRHSSLFVLDFFGKKRQNETDASLDTLIQSVFNNDNNECSTL